MTKDFKVNNTVDHFQPKPSVEWSPMAQVNVKSKIDTQGGGSAFCRRNDIEVSFN